MYEIIRVGKQGARRDDIGVRDMVAEAIMDIEREERGLGPNTILPKKGSTSGPTRMVHLPGRSEGFCQTSSASGAGRRNCITELRGVEETGRLSEEVLEQDVRFSGREY